MVSDEPTFSNNQEFFVYSRNSRDQQGRYFFFSIISLFYIQTNVTMNNVVI